MSPTSISPDAAAQIQSIEHNVEALRTAINRARQVRLLMVVVLIVVLVAIVYMFMNLAKRVTSEAFVNDVATLAQQHVTNNHEAYQKQVKEFVDTSYPVVSGAFTTQAQKDLPKFTAAFDKERDTFITNLRDRMDEKMSAKYKQLLAEHENLIVAEFPELKDKEIREKVLANFQLVIEKLVKRNYGDQFDQESQKLIALWESFPAAAEPGPDGPPLEEKLLEHSLQVAAGVMSSIPQQPVATSANSPSTPLPSAPVTAASTAGAAARPIPPPAEDAKEEPKIEPQPEKPKESEAASSPPQPETPKETEKPKETEQTNEAEKPKETGDAGAPSPTEPPK